MVRLYPKFRSKRQRLAAVALVAFCLVATAVAYTTLKIIKPSTWYFFTVDNGSIDIRSPTGKRIIEMDAYSSQETMQLFRERCGNFELLPGAPVLATYREISLCNPARAVGDGFSVRFEYFKRRVDELYGEYFFGVVTHFAFWLFLGVAAWSVMMAGWGLGRWVSKGT
jgi:hypothetical protein